MTKIFHSAQISQLLVANAAYACGRWFLLPGEDGGISAVYLLMSMVRFYLNVLYGQPLSRKNATLSDEWFADFQVTFYFVSEEVLVQFSSAPVKNSEESLTFEQRNGSNWASQSVGKQMASPVFVLRVFRCCCCNNKTCGNFPSRQLQRKTSAKHFFSKI